MINDIIDAISTVVTSATGLRCVEVTDNPPTPCAMVRLGEAIGEGGTYYRAMKAGVVDIPIIVEPVIAASASVRSATRMLNDLLDPFGDRSIPIAIFNAPTLDLTSSVAAPGTTYTVHVESVTAVAPLFAADGAIRYWTARVNINVKVTRGSL